MKVAAGQAVSVAGGLAANVATASWDGDHGASVTALDESGDGVELGLSICYDGCFPEPTRVAALDGAVG